MICEWCDEEILPDEPRVKDDDGFMHLHCAVAEQDGFTIDNECGDR